MFFDWSGNINLCIHTENILFNRLRLCCVCMCVLITLLIFYYEFPMGYYGDVCSILYDLSTYYTKHILYWFFEKQNIFFLFNGKMWSYYKTFTKRLSGFNWGFIINKNYTFVFVHNLLLPTKPKKCQPTKSLSVNVFFSVSHKLFIVILKITTHLWKSFNEFISLICI